MLVPIDLSVIYKAPLLPDDSFCGRPNPSQIKQVNGSGDNRMPKGELWRVSVSTPSRYVDSPHPKKTPDPICISSGCLFHPRDCREYTPGAAIRPKRTRPLPYN